ncbi:RNA polymerase sigma factor [Eilatimonas milleporae]|uniref:RNA polymerase sigma-70 factor (ECF subfamily) n=1 Tax=Eilatimonas milleporae TaxID=911205 RepID=A0A3M0CSI1_9PROT|nr:sigma-70 family RNA polymerase sigma factor [Eilatimonas milleporae]RMB11877.1 RNA polymerase sigma-70 factor (ECF subfamily) [Eilatimonas milleporae]
MRDIPPGTATGDDGVDAEKCSSLSAVTSASRARLKSNDDIEDLYKEHSSYLIASLRRMFGNGPPDPEDVAQQAFEKLMLRPDRSDIRDLRAFLWRTARNTFLNGLDRENTRTRHDFEVENLFFPSRGDNSTPEAVLEVKAELNAINQALRRMPEKRRHAFLLHKVEGLSVSDVARRLKISRTPTQKHITRAAHDIEIYLAERLRGRTK